MSQSSTIIRISIICVSIVLIVLSSIYIWLIQSRPTLDGARHIMGLTDTVTIERDQRGMPTITATNRIDLARVTGFVHGQERFFQMDLLRRNSAGELAELFGGPALAHDKKIRLHQFRMRAQRGVELLPDYHRDILTAYTDGVNSGLNELNAVPFEYTLLGVDAKPWQEADSLLVVYSMYLDLQEHDGITERSRTLLNQFLPQDLYDFIHPDGGEWDAPIDGSIGHNPTIPKNTWPSKQTELLNSFQSHQQTTQEHSVLMDMEPEDYNPGSNNWVISGQLTTYPSAMLADDMHLGINVPNIWFRAYLKWRENNKTHQLIGLTLPGAPALVVGSNTHVAWGFTNSYGDWSDVIQLQLSDNGEQYLTPNGYQAFHTVGERIAVKNAPDVALEIKQTIWGPVIAKDGQGNLLAYRWLAHDESATNLNFIELEKAMTADEVLTTGATLGMPAQNLVTADSQGNIGWTITNSIPVRHGFSGEFISDWSDGSKGWSGYLPKIDNPKVYNPSNQRIWTANSRVVGGEMYNIIGDGGYAFGARAKQIRDGLFAKGTYLEQDLLNIQLDDRAVFLQRWHHLLLNNVVPKSDRSDVDALTKALQNWSGAARIEDQGYLLTRQFRLKVRNLIFADLVHHLTALDPNFKFKRVRNYAEYAMWTLASEQPNHLLPPNYSSWDQLLVKALNAALEELDSEYGSWQDVTWGEFNQVNISHPMSPFVPGLSWLTDMPKQYQPGDTNMPRVAGPDFGASQRIVVAPGQESKAILHMPSSQAAHPLLPYFGMEHDPWLKGEPTPLLPGDTEYLLTLQPGSHE